MCGFCGKSVSSSSEIKKKRLHKIYAKKTSYASDIRQVSKEMKCVGFDLICITPLLKAVIEWVVFLFAVTLQSRKKGHLI